MGKKLKRKTIRIGNRLIGEGYKVYIIAEAGINHQGDVQLGKALIDMAVAAGCDCVKFQKRDLPTLYSEKALKHTDNQQQDLQYTLSNLKKVELSEDEMVSLKEYCTDKGIEFLCTPWDETSLRFLARLNLPAYKIGSPDMCNYNLIDSIVQLKKPIIVSTGMSYQSEVDSLIAHLNQNDACYALLHCNSAYPAPYSDINLNFMQTLKEKGVSVIGYSSHDVGLSVSLAAVAMGAKIIEKHITLDKTMVGQDHRASMVKEELCELVKQIRIVETALGSKVRYLSRGEYLNRESSSKSIVAAKDLKAGDIIQHSSLAFKCPGMGVNPLKKDYFIGKKLMRYVGKDNFILESDVDEKQVANISDLKINHKWGMVARMDDIDTLLQTKPDFVEIHPTGAEITRNADYVKGYDIDIVVHAPEYDRELLIDPSSLDEKIRCESVDFLKKSMDYFKKIKRLFRNRDSDIKYVLHPGGMNMDAPLLNHIPQLNTNLLESVNELQAYGRGFEILIENHPPFPWYFGGQWYHASFMDADEIVQFSQKTGYGIIFDLSHAALYCNAYNKDLEEYTKKILPVTKYIHVADASGVSGEGIPIGDGTIDFCRILPYINKKKVWILSEIWQGHKFGGQGFVNAIQKLKEINKDF